MANKYAQLKPSNGDPTAARALCLSPTVLAKFRVWHLRAEGRLPRPNNPLEMLVQEGFITEPDGGEGAQQLRQAAEMLKKALALLPNPDDPAACEQEIANAAAAYSNALGLLAGVTYFSESEIELRVLGYHMPKLCEKSGKVMERATTEVVPRRPKSVFSKVDLGFVPRNIRELIHAIERLTAKVCNPINAEKAMERLSPRFEEILRTYPETLLPRTMLHLEDGNGGIKYLMSGFFDDGQGRPMVVNYMANASCEVRVAITYMSSSQAAWRLMTDIHYLYDATLIYDKGEHGEFSITLPFEVQQALDMLYYEYVRSGQRIITIKPWDVVICADDEPVSDFRARQNRIYATQLYLIGESQTESPQWMRSVRAGRNKSGWKKVCDYNELQAFTDNLKRTGLFPHFEQAAVITETAHSEFYGEFVRALVPSENGEFRYVFNITRAGVFLVNVEAANSNKNKYGLNEEIPVIEFPEIMMLPVIEYGELIERYNLQKGEWFMGHYHRVENHHNRIELLAKASEFFSILQNKKV